MNQVLLKGQGNKAITDESDMFIYFFGVVIDIF